MFDGYKPADPLFHKPNRIDAVLGVEIYARILRSGFESLNQQHTLIAQYTEMGWIFSGTIGVVTSRRAAITPKLPRISCQAVIFDELTTLLSKFWKIEEVPTLPSNLGPDEQKCEYHFQQTHRRDINGRYIVRLPMKHEPVPGSGLSRESALASFQALTRRLEGDKELSDEYRVFMSDYERLGHMEVVPPDEVNSQRSWYLPHHAVVQNTMRGRKIRVVFDASRRVNQKGSLNDVLLSGPPLQRDLSLVLLDWRQHRFVFTADMVKMFRQILIDPEDRDFQRIIWSPEKDGNPRDYRLRTVTYGTSSAPFLALRTLIQLAEDEGSRFPLAAHCLKQQTYVDDVFSGANDLPTVRRIKDQLVEMLGTAGIHLDKWASNEASLLPRIENVVNETTDEKVIRFDDSVKTLGLIWNPKCDSFSFNVEIPDTNNDTLTKRRILAELSRLFDPLGWLAPYVVGAKIIMQDLWILKVDWDAPVPSDLRQRWTTYRQNLEKVREVEVHRWLGPTQDAVSTLHGFADASKRAFAAVIYLRVVDGNDKVRVRLLTAKTKIAPIKTISIPNLELCGAVLLVKLINHIKELDFFKNIPVTAWLDSRDALAWINSHPSRWKTFVANRVSYIQTNLPTAIWKYVSTKENPADLATRGPTSEFLKSDEKWWSGPDWFRNPESTWPDQPKLASSNPVQTFNAVSHSFVTITTENESKEDPILKRFSSIHKLVRVVAYCFRFVKYCRMQKEGSIPNRGFLTVQNLAQAREAVIRLAQSSAFKLELSLLRKNRPIPNRNTLSGLNPFLDKDGILRVGGRLERSQLAYGAKHPPILPKKSELSTLLVRDAHRNALHGGLTVTLGFLLQTAWIIGARGLVKKEVRRCVLCTKMKPKRVTQMMGDLPSARVTPSRAFAITGVDYAGPIVLRSSSQRSRATTKGYIALFVCLASKAIHLEAVSDMKTKSFLAAFSRFTSRRNKCQKLYSDNGSTFQGADRELRQMFQASSSFYGQIAEKLAIRGVIWSFIPPNSPHFGGLWEAGVKATKHHLLRVIGNHHLTYEELSTVLAEIEVCLNSRPLCPLTGNEEDLNVLTPAHFLSDGTPDLIPDAPIPDVPENRLSRFELITRIRQHFWKRWSREYLHHLQQRSKWRCPNENFRKGQLVIVQDNRYPPLKWPLGRIIETHPGDDGLVRVVTVKTAVNIMKRPIVRLSPLPILDEKMDTE